MKDIILYPEFYHEEECMLAYVPKLTMAEDWLSIDEHAVALAELYKIRRELNTWFPIRPSGTRTIKPSGTVGMIGRVGVGHFPPSNSGGGYARRTKI